MVYKQVRFTETADLWFYRHRHISPLKVASIAKYRSGEVFEKTDGCYVIKTTIIDHGKLSDLYIKTREVGDEIIVEIIVLKIHLGYVSDITLF